MEKTSEPFRILVVEDDPVYRDIYEEILGTRYRLDMAENKERALQLINANAYELAIIDMRLEANQMGNTDGLDVAKSFRELRCPTLLVLRSGFPIESDEIKKRVEELDFFSILEKSSKVQVKEIEDCVVLAKERLQTSAALPRLAELARGGAHHD